MSKLWGARFDGKTSKLADKFTFSISYDHRLAKYDVIGSIAHAQMLCKQGIIPKADGNKIIAGLTKILSEIESGSFKYDPTAEDIHTDIQNRLKKLIGDAANKLHTARSRNDQVVLDVKLYCWDEIEQIFKAATVLQQAILGFAKTNKDVIIPAYTHLQSAQVVLLAHHMLAYVEMLERDKGRLADCLKRVNVMPLGSCALSGTSLKTDRAYTTKLLGFAETAQNSMDAVSSRDFIAEAISTCAIMSVNISRISEDLILWATKEFDFVDIDWSMCTGSSIMPHKKNPDVLELLRGTTAKMIAHVTEILTLTKALPLTYNRDLQLDKPVLFDTVETSKDSLLVLASLFETLKVKKESIAAKVADESFFTVDLMDVMIKEGMSYRDAHDKVGKMVKESLDKGKKLSQHPDVPKNAKNLFNAQMSVKIKTSLGSTNPTLVEKQLALWSKKINA
jgi:argininosuccinate lyase